MLRINSIFHIAMSGFYQRVRTYQYLIVLLFTMILGYIAIPVPDAIYSPLVIDGYRGFYNSAWFGAIAGIWLSMFLSLFGFYVVKNAIQMDYNSKTGDILASTQMKNWEYIIGKWLSNFLILASMVLVFDTSLIAMFFLRAETKVFNLWLLIAPSMFIVLPGLAFIAALAIIFEIIPFLRNGFGNFLFFWIWMGQLILNLTILSLDPLGYTLVLNSIYDQAKIQYPSINANSIVIGGYAVKDYSKLILFTGVRWTLEIILSRLMWVAISLGIVLICSLLFDRFNPEKNQFFGKKTPKSKIKNNENHEEYSKNDTLLQEFQERKITPLSSHEYRGNLKSIFLTELKIYLKIIPVFWYIVLIGLIIAGILVPIEIFRIIFPITWIWPLLIWSRVGLMEHSNGTDPLIYSTPYPLKYHFLATWLVGLLLTLGTGIVGGIRMLITVNWVGFIAWIVGGYFIASFAIFSATLTKSSKFFEFIYTLLWYIGPMNQVPLLDFMGIVPLSVTMNIWVYYLGIAIIFTLIAFWAKKRMILNV